MFFFSPAFYGPRTLRESSVSKVQYGPQTRYSPLSHYGLDVVPKTPNFIPALKYGHLLVVSL